MTKSRSQSKQLEVTARERVIEDAAITRRRAESGAVAWSAVYNGGTLLALICSTASTFILAINPASLLSIQTHTLTAGISAAAALAIGVPKYLNAENKWRANRRCRSEARILERFLADPNFSTEAARDWLSEIERDHESFLTGRNERREAENT